MNKQSRFYCEDDCTVFDIDTFASMSNAERDECLKCLRDEDEQVKSLLNSDFFVFDFAGMSLVRAVNVVQK